MLEHVTYLARTVSVSYVTILHKTRAAL